LGDSGSEGATGACKLAVSIGSKPHSISDISTPQVGWKRKKKKNSSIERVGFTLPHTKYLQGKEDRQSNMTSL
jgi:hypothetical protein